MKFIIEKKRRLKIHINKLILLNDVEKIPVICSLTNWWVAKLNLINIFSFCFFII